MKTLFLLLIIYDIQNFALSDDGSAIIHKTYPKKAYLGHDHIKLLNTGTQFKKHLKSEKNKSFTRFRPPVPEWNHKAAGKSDDLAQKFPFDIYDNAKTRVKKLTYFDDKDKARRSKRAANDSQAASSSTGAPPSKLSSKPKESPKPKEEPKPSTTPKPKENNTSPKVKENPAASKNVTAVRRSAVKSGKAVAKPHRKLSKSPPLRHKSAAKGAVAKKRPRKVQRLGGKKHQKHALRKGNKRSRVRNARNLKGKGVKRLGKKAVTRSKAHHKAVKAPRGGRRLIAARDAYPEDYPYVVSIQKNRKHWCAGAILNPKLIISTANCFWKSRSTTRMRVRAGAESVDHGGQLVGIAIVIKHPGWSIRKEPDNDLALALLEKSLKFSDSVHGVDLPNKIMSPAFDDVWVTSYGADRRDGVFNRVRMTMQVMYAKLMPHKKCNNITLRFNVEVTENFICLEQAGRRAPCTRDTGAPAVSDGILWGLASWGIRKLCGTERFPAMFSYLASKSNMNFIANATASLMSDKRTNPMMDRIQPYVEIKTNNQNY